MKIPDIRRTMGVALSLAMALPIPDAGAWGRFEGGHHPAYPGGWARPHPEVIHRTYVEHGRGGGCVGCGVGDAAVAGLLGGAIIGAAISGASAPPPETVVVQQPPPVVIQQVPVGTEVAALPPGCGSTYVNGVTYYQCGPTWYQPYFGGNGVYYSVVPGPG